MSAPAVSPRASPLPSIMARPSPRTHSPLRSLSFHENAPAPDVVPMPPVSPLPPTPSGILLNKFKFDAADGGEAVSPALASPPAPRAAQAGAHPDALAASQSLALGLGLVGGGQLGGSTSGGLGALGASLARVASPDGDGSTSGTSVTCSTADAGSTSTSTSPSPALKAGPLGPRSQSPAEAIASLTLLTAPSSPPPPPRPRSRSPSPHCKFAPLPRIDNLERPGTRRNSSVQGTPLVSRARVEAQEEQFAIDLDDSLAVSSPLLPANASMGLVAGASRPGGTPSRRSSGSASGRSSSPSPIRRSASNASSRTHSPIMSRHSSTEALHLHYISGALPRSSNRSSSRERSGSITANEVLRRRDETPSAPASGRASPSAVAALESGSAATSPILASTLTLPSLFSAVAAAAAPLDAAGTTPTPRRTVFIEPPELPSGLDQLEEEDDESDGDDDGSDDDDEGEGNRDEENGDEDGSADEDDGDEVPRATARGAAVEVVHWHKGDPKN